MLENAKQILGSVYDIKALFLQPIPAGWSSAAFKVHAPSGDYFLKVYDKNKPTAQSWIARTDAYMPVVLWLNDHTPLRQKMTAPLLTWDGSYKYEDAAYLYMVFPFIDGWTINDAKLKPDQTRELAEIVALLHAYSTEIPVPTDDLLEIFDISFCDALSVWLKNNQDSVLNKALTPHADIIARSIESLRKSVDTLRHSEMRYSLCHTDIHGWNLMQSDRLVLIDWEGLKLAPVEADLFSFTDTFFFGYAWEDFLTVYRSVHKAFEVNPIALRFYRLRRRLEDIHTFAESILFDNLTREEKNRSLFHLKQECALLHRML
jgi:Ser/Thr protein kinase RdoA (MazF antagonist)